MDQQQGSSPASRRSSFRIQQDDDMIGGGGVQQKGKNMSLLRLATGTSGAYFRVLLYHYNYVFRNCRCRRVLCELEWWVVHHVIIGVMQIKEIINPHNFYPSETRQTLFTIANFIPHLSWISIDMCCA